jgi:subtilisin-like proprotein convertase family protein
VNESSPSDWTFQGSNDGVTWSDLDTQTGISWFAGERKLFQFANATAYLYYRVFLTDNTYLKNLFPSTVNLVFLLNEIEMFGTASSQACANATATSSVSQADADSKALASATTKANALLNCQRLYTSTQTFTAHCTAGALGTPVTKSGSATSFVSQDDADSKALAIAMEAANAALVCTGDNHNQAISINDLAAATPYPSVKYVSGETGHITNVTVTVKNFSHGSPSDVQMVLQSPSGTYVQLMLRCGGPGGSNPCSDLTFVFDDAAGGALPQFGALSGGTFKPSHYGITPNLLAPAAAAPYQATLAALIGEDPNGPWALWIVDLLGIGIGTVAGVPAFNVAITSA